MDKQEKEFTELGFRVIASPHDYHVDYQIYLLNDLDDEIELGGHVKWDGCSNWTTNEDCMYHACSRQDIINIGLILAECYDWTKELCPNWIKEQTPQTSQG